MKKNYIKPIIEIVNIETNNSLLLCTSNCDHKWGNAKGTCGTNCDCGCSHPEAKETVFDTFEDEYDY